MWSRQPLVVGFLREKVDEWCLRYQDGKNLTLVPILKEAADRLADKSLPLLSTVHELLAVEVRYIQQSQRKDSLMGNPL